MLSPVDEIDLVHQLLATKYPTYAELSSVSIPPTPCNEPMIAIEETETLSAKQINLNGSTYNDEPIYVREMVGVMLREAAALLAEISHGLGLQVVYGYRRLEDQRLLCDRFMTLFQNMYSGDELIEKVHQNVAIPDVAGHPTGGAVDLQIVRNGEPVDHGAAIWDFETNTAALSPFVSVEAWRNRQLLRHTMIRIGFVPFDGEWWHFSYGDREWAFANGKPHAIYDQLDQQGLERLLA